MSAKTITIHQPQYLPWVPYFDKILRSDVFVILDNVQFQKNGLQNRNQIKTVNGVTWLTVPVQHSFGQAISETKIADQKQVHKHLKTIEMAYKKSPYYAEIIELVRPVIEADHTFLSNLNCELLGNFLGYLEYKGDVIKASELGVTGKGSDLVLNICKTLNADVYISGAGGKDYMKLEDFENSNIKVVFQEYKNVEYPQLFQEQGFVRDLSILDLLFNNGKESIGFIEKGRIA